MDWSFPAFRQYRGAVFSGDSLEYILTHGDKAFLRDTLFHVAVEQNVERLVITDAFTAIIAAVQMRFHFLADFKGQYIVTVGFEIIFI